MPLTQNSFKIYPSLIGVRAGGGGGGGGGGARGATAPPPKKIFFEYFVIRATDPNDSGKRNLASLIKFLVCSLIRLEQCLKYACEVALL